MSDRTPAEIAAEGMMRDMFAPHELPLTSELQGLYRSTARATLSALEKEGWVLVPREPTPAMLAAGRYGNPTTWSKRTEDGFQTVVANDVYLTMIAARPQQGGKP